MEVITMESKAFQQLKGQLDEILAQVKISQKQPSLSEIWLDNQDVIRLLHVSKRTLQHYRDSGKMPFSQIGAKIYYKASDLEQLLNDNYSLK
ncbi:MAG: helix-turn-helix domain-containing protein [Flavobacteriales bacterium]